MAKAPKYTARTVDRHELYQHSVQVPEADIRFLDRIYSKARGRKPKSLREDFCGTAFLSTEWVKAGLDRVAYGVDLDAPTLAWAREHNLSSMEEGQRARIHLDRANVLTIKQPAVDIQVAFNFSYWCFKKRSALKEYFKAVRASVAKDGFFVLDMHGGWESAQEVVERKRLPGFHYVWEQERFNPIDHSIRCHIHFEFPDGTKLRRAFSYEWRWWTLMEIRDLLEDAGFRKSDVYWEGTERGTRKGDGVFRLAHRGDNDPSWVTYVVASP